MYTAYSGGRGIALADNPLLLQFSLCNGLVSSTDVNITVISGLPTITQLICGLGNECVRGEHYVVWVWAAWCRIKYYLAATKKYKRVWSSRRVIFLGNYLDIRCTCKLIFWWYVTGYTKSLPFNVTLSGQMAQRATLELVLTCNSNEKPIVQKRISETVKSIATTLLEE